MKIITELSGTITDFDSAKHPMSKSMRAGYHTSPNPGPSRFFGIRSGELHMHSGKSMVVIPLDDLVALAKKADPSFK